MTLESIVKVSVVVPVYNPGENIEGLISSLAGQSLPAHELEVVFVDDGSTDGTADRLAEVCADHPNMRTTTIPNSGWPGRPRNVGTDLATGEFVFYCDNDDELFPEALERMYALATANGSDIVYGKVVRTGRATPYWPLAARTIPVADPVADRIALSRTVHKLFRRDFLVRNGIRFPEGRVRLEDFSFMGQAIPQARVISVLADYPCYRWIHRPDGTNNSTNAVKQSVYWGYFTSALQTFADLSGEGPLLDSVRLVAAEQAFSRFQPASYLKRTPAGQDSAIAALHDYVVAQVPPRLDPQLPVLKRLRVQALRDNDKERFDALQLARTAYSFDVRMEDLRWDGGRLRVVARGELLHAGKPAVLPAGERPGELAVPLPDRLADQVALADRAVRDEDLGSLEITVRHRATGTEWPVDCVSTREPRSSAEGTRLTVRVEAAIDPAAGAFGAQLEDGVWDVMARVQFLGESSLVGLTPHRPWGSGTALVGERSARAYVTQGGKVALTLTREAVGTTAGAPVATAATWQDGALVLRLAAAAATGTFVVLRRRAGGDGRRFAVEAGQACVSADHLAPGEVGDAYLRVESALGAIDRRLVLAPQTVQQHPAYAVSAGADNGLSIRRLGPDAAPPEALVVTAAAARAPRPGRERPSARAVAGMLPAPVQRVIRGVRRRVLARR